MSITFQTVTLINSYNDPVDTEYCKTSQEVRECVLQLLEVIEPGERIEFGVLEV